MLQKENRGIIFSGGIDSRLLSPWKVEWLRGLKIKELWFSCDTAAALPHLERAAKLFKDVPSRKKRCYVMIGYGDETIAAARKRLERVYALGFWPFSQLYRRAGVLNSCYTDEWTDLNRKWSRPALYRTKKGGCDAQ
jgi:hypothetical protein